MKLSISDWLILVDLQNDFFSGGALAVPQADEILPVIRQLGGIFGRAVLTQDWHPQGHQSFASAHPGKRPFESVQLPYGKQVLWPDHCVQGSRGAEFHAGLRLPQTSLVVRKGWHPQIDSYSTFFENDRVTPTGLHGYLQEQRAKHLFLAGLATDYCVHYSALDARRLGYEVAVIEDACRGIDLGGSLAKAWAEMEAAGVRRLTAREVVHE